MYLSKIIETLLTAGEPGQAQEVADMAAAAGNVDINTLATEPPRYVVRDEDNNVVFISENYTWYEPSDWVHAIDDGEPSDWPDDWQTADPAATAETYYDRGTIYDRVDTRHVDDRDQAPRVADLAAVLTLYQEITS